MAMIVNTSGRHQIAKDTLFSNMHSSHSKHIMIFKGILYTFLNIISSVNCVKEKKRKDMFLFHWRMFYVISNVLQLFILLLTISCFIMFIQIDDTKIQIKSKIIHKKLALYLLGKEKSPRTKLFWIVFFSVFKLNINHVWPWLLGDCLDVMIRVIYNEFSTRDIPQYCKFMYIKFELLYLCIGMGHFSNFNFFKPFPILGSDKNKCTF